MGNDMSFRTILRLSVAPLLVSLFFFSASVVPAVIVTANCTSLSWTFNSHGQSPCIIAANMLATCYAGSYMLPPLLPGDAYGGPRSENSNYCECSTVGYSLMSACAACQERTPFTWSQYVFNCTSTLPPSMFPNPVPPETSVPYWAILDVTKENGWSATESNAVSNNPEFGPGAIFGPSGVSTSSASASSSTASTSTSTSSAAASPTATPKPPHSKGHVSLLAIMGSVASGVLFLIVLAGIFYLLWKKVLRPRRQRRAQAILESNIISMNLPGGQAEPLLMSEDGRMLTSEDGTSQLRATEASTEDGRMMLMSEDRRTASRLRAPEFSLMMSEDARTSSRVASWLGRPAPSMMMSEDGTSDSGRI